MLTKKLFGLGCLLVASSVSLMAASDVADAAMNRDKTGLRALLQKKADVNAPQPDGATALFWAARWDDMEMADLLLAAGADPKAANRDGATALFLACENGSAPMIAKLVKAGADVNTPFLLHGETALMVASRTGRADAVKVLLDAGANVDAKETLRMTTAVMWAAEQNHPEVVKLLVEHGADVKAQSRIKEPPAGRRRPVQDDNMEDAPPPAGRTGGLTALVYAAREGGLEATRILIEAGADVNQTTADGSSPLLVAVQNGHYDVATYLVEHGANIDAQNERGWSPLYLAVKNRNIETGTLPNPSPEGSYEFTKLLLDKGANPNVRSRANTEIRNSFRATWLSENGATPFLRAALCGDLELMKLLLAHGADPNIATVDHTTPLMALAGVGFSDGFIHEHGEEAESLAAMKLMLDLGADVNAKNDQGLTALHGAAHKANLGFIQMLVDRGGDLSARDNGKINNDSAEALIPLNWAEGVRIGVQSAIYHPEAVDLITKLMNEKGIPIPNNTRTIGGNAKAQTLTEDRLKLVDEKK